MKWLFACCCALLFCGCVQPRGAVCFTFDDFDPVGWVKSDELFKKYDGHATFFFSGNIDKKRLEVMKKLSASGHSIGLHTVHHADAVPLKDGDSVELYFKREIQPQLDVCRANNIKIRSFAYPNNRHNAETDEFLFQYFDFLRAGYGKGNPVIYIPLESLPDKMVMPGGGIGKYYKSKVENLIAILDRAADNGQLVVFFSHQIKPNADHVHISPEMLEALLAHARKRNMYIISAEEIPTLGKK